MTSDPSAPRPLGGIRNFGWVIPGVLARGEQPPLDAESFDALRAAGIGSILSLREHNEEALPVDGRPLPPYGVAEERGWCERFGLHFQHIGCVEAEVTPAEDLVAALEAIDREIGLGRAVFVHCRAGVGRTGVVTGAWLIASGSTGDDAARLHERFLGELDGRLAIPAGERAHYFQPMGRARSWWGLRTIAEALGSPITGDYNLPGPEPPVGADSLEERYREALRPWREGRNSA